MKFFELQILDKEPSTLQNFQKENLLHDCSMENGMNRFWMDIDEVIISPGIAQSERIVQWIRKKKIKLLSDIELFGRHSNAPIIGITGSNGKSTVTQLLGDMAIASNLNAVMCGNIGSPVWRVLVILQIYILLNFPVISWTTQVDWNYLLV